MQDIQIYNGDCLEIMKDISDKSIDMILCDLPYGTTKNKWDTVLEFELLWEQYERIIKKNGAIILFSSQPFTTSLIASNIKNFKYCWIWKKSRFANQMLAKKQPLKIHEDICVFSYGSHEYNPQGLKKIDKITKQGRNITDNLGGGKRKTEYLQEFTNYPKSILDFKSAGKTLHPTQKPVELLEYLIKTYSKENYLILDNCMGSGSTGVAAKNLNRRFIGIELEKKYFNIAEKRMLGEIVHRKIEEPEQNYKLPGF